MDVKDEPAYNNFNDLILGIDLGTTAVKTVLISSINGNLIKDQYCETDAGSTIQDVQKIFNALETCLLNFPLVLLEKVKKIAVTGQMHGVVLWKRFKHWPNDIDVNSLKIKDRFVSSLYTWEYSINDNNFLDSLPKYNNNQLATGFGNVTLFWLSDKQEDLLKAYDCAGTIQDLLVSILVRNEHPVMNEQNANSWGYYDMQQKNWCDGLLKNEKFPGRLLPTINKSELPLDQDIHTAGKLSTDFFGIKSETTFVSVAMGDLPCTVRALLHKHNYKDTAILNIGTSAQLAYVLEQNEILYLNNSNSVQFIPYFRNFNLAVAASLNGGNVLQHFIKSIKCWMDELGVIMTEKEIWGKIDNLQIKYLNENKHQLTSSSLHITPLIFGERHLSSSSESYSFVSNITANNSQSLLSIYNGICQGIVANLHSMMPNFGKKNINHLLAAGSVVSKNKLFTNFIQEEFHLPIIVKDDCRYHAAIGAAYAFANI